MTQQEFEKKWKPRGRGIPKSMTEQFESDIKALQKEHAKEAFFAGFDKCQSGGSSDFESWILEHGKYPNQ